jgi:hypothetical protein
VLASAVTADKAPHFDENEPYFPQVSNYISLAAQGMLMDRGTMPNQLEQSTSVPCNYYWNNSWYLFADSDLTVYLTNQEKASDAYAGFTFCKKITDIEDQISATEPTEVNSGMIYCSDANNYDYYATVATQGNSGGACTPTSTSSTKSIKQTTYNNAEDEETFALFYTTDDSDNLSTLTVQMICNNDLDTPTIGDLTSSGTNQWTTTFEGKEACPTLDLSYIWDFFDNNTWLWATILIVTGALVCFFGRIFFKATVFFITTLLVTCAILLLFYTTFLKSTT